MTISGQSERLVEPETLFTFRESMEQQVELQVRLDDGEERRLTRRGTSTLRAERAARQEV